MNSITDLLHSENEYYDNQKVPGFVQGIVVENNNADFKGMVKVEFTVWETGKNMCEWVRLLSPYAGKDYGTYLVPEIDEMVLVGFIGGSLKRPFLLGSLYPSGASVVSENFDQKNLKNGKITIQSEKNISLKAGSAELTMDGNAGAVSLKAKKVTVTADNEIGLKANSALKAEGAQIDVKGQAKINLQASGPVAVKGAVVQIN